VGTGRAAAAGAFDSFFLGLGAEGLIVGAVGVASIMIISVLERRSEIGLRRALGATKGQIRTQLLAEWILLGLTGGVRSCDARRPTLPDRGAPHGLTWRPDRPRTQRRHELSRAACRQQREARAQRAAHGRSR
jgi:hypothetical protein